MVISDDSQQASRVAGGLYNPVILKRFTLAWKASGQMKLAMPFYADLKKKLGIKLDDKISVYRRFASIEEQNLWFEASDRPGLQEFLSPKIHENKNASIDAPFGLGMVNRTGKIDTRKLLENYTVDLLKREKLIKETFQFDQMELTGDAISYKGLSARRIVFAEGYGLKRNPFFNYLPLNGTKGELLTIKAPDLKENAVVKSSVFVIPLGKDQYSVGATYKWKDKTSIPTEAAKMELVAKLKTFVSCNFEVIKHVAGVRPTVGDRRPLVGRHPKHKNIFVLNGFGSRGVLIAPYASLQLCNYIEENAPLDPEMDVSRFTRKYH